MKGPAVALNHFLETIRPWSEIQFCNMHVKTIPSNHSRTSRFGTL